MLLLSAVLAFLSLASHATPLSSRSALYRDLSEKHSWGSSPPSSSWTYHSTPDPNTLLTLRFSLRPSNFDQLLSHLSETSDPYHERYGNHLSKEQVDELLQPTEETVNEVKEWLNWHGIKENDISPGSDRWINLRIPVSVAETLLNTTYSIYAHTSDVSNQILRTLEYSLPRHLHAHINLVSPTTYFGNTRGMKKTSFLQPVRLDSSTSDDASNSCNTVITPACLKDLYNVLSFCSLSLLHTLTKS